MAVDSSNCQFTNNKNLLSLDQKLGSLEEQLYQYLFSNLHSQSQAEVNKFFLVPVGLPGMGKTTLSRFLSATSQQYINDRFNQ